MGGAAVPVSSVMSKKRFGKREEKNFSNFGFFIRYCRDDPVNQWRRRKVAP
jgi:hypothetical protein